MDTETYFWMQIFFPGSQMSTPEKIRNVRRKGLKQTRIDLVDTAEDVVVLAKIADI